MKTIYTILLFLFIPLNYLLADINDGLVAYYPFDGNASDKSGNENNGIEHGEIEYVEGIIDRAIFFDGATGYIQVQDSDTLDTDHVMSISLWIKPISYSNSGSKIISKWYSAPWSGCSNCGNGDWLVGLSTSENEQNDIYFSVANFPEGSDLSDSIGTTSKPISINRWSQLSFVFDNGKLILYINGEYVTEKISTVDYTSLSEYTYDDIFIGQFWNHSNNYNFHGLIDDLRLYNKSLTTNEISSLYHMHNAYERESLIDLYNSTNGNNWSNNTFWLGEPGTECTWFGVNCDESNCVKAIHLFSNNLNGTIPNSIKNLKHLQSLLLHGNNLNGSIPIEILQIETLESITFYDNNLSNTIISLVNQKVQDELNKTDKIGIKDAIYALQIASGHFTDLKNKKYNAQNKHYYQLVEEKMSWEEALDYCQNISGYLASITSSEENDFIVNTFSKNISSCWIGGNDILNEGVWEWCNNDEWNFSNWSNGEPNNALGKEDFLMINLSTGQWNDERLYPPPSFLCEWDDK